MLDVSHIDSEFFFLQADTIAMGWIVHSRLFHASEKSIVEKMHLKPGMTVPIIDPPYGYVERIGKLPEDVRMVKSGKER
jgi:hypothetical protein